MGLFKLISSAQHTGVRQGLFPFQLAPGVEAIGDQSAGLL